MTIEQKVAEAILEKPIGTLEIGGRTYPIAPPSTGTLILVSEIVSTLPVVSGIPNDKTVAAVLHYAKDYRALGDIVAVLILGRKGLTEEREIEEVRERRILGISVGKKVSRRKVTVDVKSELAQLILDEVRPSVLMDVVIRRLRNMEIGDFFGITTSLSEANILVPTREVD
ncbi:MAG: hypothetical protein MJZ81_06210 [Bacteroidales bacterium]|nr:hypothetical protein [Bacteroidales bacterium]